jgi:hypothetical protein
MSNPLTTNETKFIKLMTENPEQAKWGFETLLKKRKDFPDFFDDLKKAGLFEPENNTGPVDSKKPGYVRIPYWSALDYLEAVAKRSGETNDLELAEKVMNVIRSVTLYCDQNGKYIDNYQTYRKFAKLIGLVPPKSVRIEDIDLVPIWLGSEYDRSLVSQTLDKGVLKSFLDSDSEDDLKKAIKIFSYCTELKLLDDPDGGSGKKKPVSIVEKYLLKQIVSNNAKKFGTKAPNESAKILYDRIQKVFIDQNGDSPSYLSRPAVEEHPQNYSFYELNNCLVEGFRDVLLTWTDLNSEDTVKYLKSVLNNNNEMAQRVAIYVINEKWNSLYRLYTDLLKPRFFDFRFLHELYHLLKNHFSKVNKLSKELTIDIIKGFSFPHDDDSEIAIKYRQRNWLSAIVGQGSDEIDAWYNELDSDAKIGPISKHPDFYFYMESRDGFEDSKYSVAELITFAELGTLIERLNSYQQTQSIRGTSTMSLVKQLEEAVVKKPQLFLKIITEFKTARRPYQYGLIVGFKKLWENPHESHPPLYWDLIWNRLIEFFEYLITDKKFWNEQVGESRDFVPTRDWIPPIISEFIESGNKRDETAYNADLLPRTFDLIKILIEKSVDIDSAGDDPMFQSINSPKGKAIEALYSYTLRVCRLSDINQNSHEDVWNEIKPTFNTEIEKCKNSNYEFSTLTGAYVNNLEYISREWLEKKLKKIFPNEYKENFMCAIDGLAYSTVSRSVYNLLIDNDVIDHALKLDEMRDTVRERLVDRISLGYLWHDETLNDGRFEYFFNNQKIEDLKSVSRFFWSVREQELTVDQIQSIKEFWHRCILLTNSLDEKPVIFLSELSRLACFITEVTDYEKGVLLAVSPYIDSDYNGDLFIKNMIRLIKEGQDLDIVCQILDSVFDNYKPDFDYKDRLKRLMLLLAEKGKIDKALIYTDKLRYLDGFFKLYGEIQDIETDNL